MSRQQIREMADIYSLAGDDLYIYLKFEISNKEKDITFKIVIT